LVGTTTVTAQGDGAGGAMYLLADSSRRRQHDLPQLTRPVRDTGGIQLSLSSWWVAHEVKVCDLGRMATAAGLLALSV
jgi:hypothetical protein